MMNRKKHAAIVILLCVATAGVANPQGRSPAPRYGIPKLGPGQLWISSIPVGLEVYPGPKVEGKPAGRTPVILDAKSVGPKVTIALRKKEGEPALPDQSELIDFTAETNTSMWIRDAGIDTDIGRALTYRVDTGRPTLIALFQSRTSTLTDWARRYPSARNFTFRDKTVRKDLSGRGVPTSYLDLAIGLLHRGGKIALPARDGWVIAEVISSGDVKVTVAPH